MKSLWVASVVGVLAFGCGGSKVQRTGVEASAEAPVVVTERVETIERILRSTVTILCSSDDGKGALGSGVLYESSGRLFVITAAHVINSHEGLTIFVVFTGSDTDSVDHMEKAKLVASNDPLDVAILEIETKTRMYSGAKFMNSIPRVGVDVFAVGSPLGEMNTVTEGIVCHNQRKVPWCEKRHIQVSCNGGQGSSGGGVFDASGTCVGLVVRINMETRVLIILPMKEVFDWMAANNLCDISPPIT